MFKGTLTGMAAKCHNNKMTALVTLLSENEKKEKHSKYKYKTKL